MTRNELTDHYNRKVTLIADMSALKKMQEYLAEHQSHLGKNQDMQMLIDGMNADISSMESSIQKRTEALSENEEIVRTALKSIPDRTSRIAASLRYCNGLSWAETGAILHVSEAAIKSRVYRAMDGAGILWEK